LLGSNRQKGKATFFISKQGDPNNLDDAQGTSNSSGQKVSQPKVAKEIDLNNPTRSIVDDLRVYKHLKSTSKVPAFKTNEPIHAKQPVLNHIRLQIKEKQSIENAAKRKDLRLKDAVEKRKKRSRAFDLWEVKEKTPVFGGYVEYVEDFEHLHLAQLGKCPPKPNVTAKPKPSLLPACEQPHPGISYNPNDEDHTKLLLQVADKKKKEMRAKKKLDRKIKEHHNSGVDIEAENAKEMLQGLSDDEEQMQGVEEEEIAATVLASDSKHRKTRKQARHEVLSRKLKAIAEQRRQINRFNSEFFKIRSYLREHSLKTKLAKQKKEFRVKMEEERLYKPARFGRQAYVEQDQEFSLPSELQGSMRKLTTDGNLLVDRFKSFQKRNLIEHRVVLKLGKSKAKRKKIVNQSLFNHDFYQLKNQTA
jgi:hypothetical protein